MKALTAFALSAALVASSALAGGPVVVVEDTEPLVEEKPAPVHRDVRAGRRSAAALSPARPFQ